MPEGIDPDTQSSLQSAAAKLIDNRIKPAINALLICLESDYQPAARPPGIGALSRGKQLNSGLAQHFTTTELIPDEMHEIGLREVARIREEIDAVIDTVGIEADIATFNEVPRTDS